MIISISNAPRYNWSSQSLAYVLCNENNLNVKLEIIRPGDYEPMHYHKIALQFFYVVKGKLTIQTSEAVYELADAESILIRPGIKHKVINQSTEETKYILISQPSVNDDRQQ